MEKTINQIPAARLRGIDRITMIMAVMMTMATFTAFAICATVIMIISAPIQATRQILKRATLQQEAR